MLGILVLNLGWSHKILVKHTLYQKTIEWQELALEARLIIPTFHLPLSGNSPAFMPCYPLSCYHPRWYSQSPSIAKLEWYLELCDPMVFSCKLWDCKTCVHSITNPKIRPGNYHYSPFVWFLILHDTPLFVWSASILFQALWNEILKPVYVNYWGIQRVDLNTTIHLP